VQVAVHFIGGDMVEAEGLLLLPQARTSSDGPPPAE
jgi:hypothetical protein